MEVLAHVLLMAWHHHVPHLVLLAEVLVGGYVFWRAARWLRS